MKIETMKFNLDPQFPEITNSYGIASDPDIAPPVIEIKSRRKAREAALQALYSCETLSDWSAGTIHAYFDCFHRLEIASLGAREGALRFCLELIEGVVLHGAEIDKIISDSSENWSIIRMAQVDRNVLRLAVFEICFRGDIPLSVVLNEAVELARTFSSDEAPKFVNGVLNRITQRADLKQSYPAFEVRVAAELKSV